MKIISKLLFLFPIFFASCFSQAQEIQNVESLLVKEWMLQSYEVNGQTFPPKENHANDRMIFYSDKRVESISSDEVQDGIWSYDPTSRIITVVEKKIEFEMKLKLISITDSNCVLEIENPKGTFIKMNLIPK